MKGHVNSSGFPLQIAIANLVNDHSHLHGWSIRYSEHSWSNRDTGESGFIDLVIEHQAKTLNLVVECKRVKDTSWIFLDPSSKSKNRRHAKSFVSKKGGMNAERFEWLDLTLDPTTPESQFCVIPGNDNRSQSLIERSSAELVSATEALAQEDRGIFFSDSGDLKIYFNVIVTTADLKVCNFDPASISLKDGTIEDPHFVDVPFLRFRKQLNPIFKVPSLKGILGSQGVERAKENTVFVVNSEKLFDFLRAFEVDNRGSNLNFIS